MRIFGWFGFGVYVAMMASIHPCAAGSEVSADASIPGILQRNADVTTAERSAFSRAAAEVFDALGPRVGGPLKPASAASQPAPRLQLLSSQDMLVGVRGGWARYRFLTDDPFDPGLVVEATARITDLGVKAVFLYLSPIKGTSEINLLQVAQAARFQSVFSQLAAKQVRLVAFTTFAQYPGDLPGALIPPGTVNGTPLPLPYSGTSSSDETALLQEEYTQLYNLTVYLRNHPSLAGVSVVLKNWETDNGFCAPLSAAEATAAGDPQLEGHSACDYSVSIGADGARKQALLTRAVHFLRWLRNRQDAVAAARAATPTSAVPVYQAAEVSGVEAALGLHGFYLNDQPHLRIPHLLPYVGPDMISYSSWETFFFSVADFLNPPYNVFPYSDLVQHLHTNLYGAFDFLSSQASQKGAADYLCTSQGVCLNAVGIGVAPLSERTSDPLGLGVKRFLVAEYGVQENDLNQLAAASPWINALLDAGRCYPNPIQQSCTGGVAAAFYWSLYDNEMTWLKDCSVPLAGKAHQCESGGTYLCDRDNKTSTIPAYGCYDKNLWALDPRFTLGGSDYSGGKGPGYCLYRPDGFEGSALTILQTYTMQAHSGLWTPASLGVKAQDVVHPGIRWEAVGAKQQRNHRRGPDEPT